jgi:soluble lytic murein transglycosylase-like protein
MIAEILCAAVVAISFPRADIACAHIPTVIEASEKYELDPALVVSLIRVESRWKATAVSRSKACGLTQVLAKYSDYSCEQLKDPKTSIFEGARKLRFWIYKYGKGRIKTGLCGYNAGFRCKGKNKNATGVRYAKKVIKYANDLRDKYKQLEEELWPEVCNE